MTPFQRREEQLMAKNHDELQELKQAMKFELIYSCHLRPVVSHT